MFFFLSVIEARKVVAMYTKVFTSLVLTPSSCCDVTCNTLLVCNVAKIVIMHADDFSQNLTLVSAYDYSAVL